MLTPLWRRTEPAGQGWFCALRAAAGAGPRHPFAARRGSPAEAWIHSAGPLSPRRSTKVPVIPNSSAQQSTHVAKSCWCGGLVTSKADGKEAGKLRRRYSDEPGIVTRSTSSVRLLKTALPIGTNCTGKRAMVVFLLTCSPAGASPAPYFRREVRSTPARLTPLSAPGSPTNPRIARDHIDVFRGSNITLAVGRNVPLSDMLSIDGTFPQRCRLARTHRNRGTRAAVLLIFAPSI